MIITFNKLKKSTIEILLMAANIAGCVYKFYPINQTASYLMMPYLAWVSFASLININIWYRNKDRKLD